MTTQDKQNLQGKAAILRQFEKGMHVKSDVSTAVLQLLFDPPLSYSHFCPVSFSHILWFLAIE